MDTQLFRGYEIRANHLPLAYVHNVSDMESALSLWAKEACYILGDIQYDKIGEYAVAPVYELDGERAGNVSVASIGTIWPTDALVIDGSEKCLNGHMLRE